MKKRAIICVVVIILSMIAIMCVYENRGKNENSEINTENVDQGIKFKVSDVICKPGDEITINIDMLDNSNFVAANFELLYDNKKMECIGYTKGDILENGAMSIVNNDTNNSKVLVGYVADPTNENNIQKAGNVLSITFKVNEELEELNINPEFKCSTLKEKDGTDIIYNIEQGIITIQK